MATAIRIEKLSKRYRLGLLGGTSLRDDLGRAWARVRGRPDPLTPVNSASRFDTSGKYIWALQEIDLEFEEGQAVGIIGHNGAGKTTLLKILSRITAPTSGCVQLRGRVASLLEVGTGFHPELTGRENIFLNGAILGMTKSEVSAKLDEIVHFSGVETYIDTPVKRYSSGMRVRLAFAVAAHLEPEILLIDEVLSVGDAAFQKKCLGKMEEVTRTGRTVLFVTHLMAMVTSLCERTVLFENGQVVADGPTPDVVLRYLDDGESSVSADAGVLLEDASHREGNGVLRFVSWSVQDEAHGEGVRVTCHEPCEFRLRYRSSPTTDELRNVSIALVLKDALGRPLLTGWTRLLGADFERLAPEGTIVCRFGGLPLVPDVYRVHLWCAVNNEVADRIPMAGTLEVTTADVFGTGRLPNKVNHGDFVLRDQAWRFEAA